MNREHFIESETLAILNGFISGIYGSGTATPEKIDGSPLSIRLRIYVPKKGQIMFPEKKPFLTFSELNDIIKDNNARIDLKSRINKYLNDVWA